MTVVNPKSISGINSITMASGSDDLLTIHSNNTTERVRVDSSGNLTATSFSGDGSSLTGVASTENIRTNTNATFLQNVNVSGTSTIGGNVKVGTGITLSPSGDVFATGITTVGTGLSMGDNVRANFGDGGDLQIYHSGSVDMIEGQSLYLIQESQNIILRNLAGDEAYAKFFGNGAVELYHNGTKQCETSASGLAFPSGKGIDFSAQTATSASGSSTTSELLDHYEEGTFTPQYNSGSANSACFAGGISYDSQVGHYTKVGNVVTFQLKLDPSSSGLTAKSGTLQINDLPFNCKNVSTNGGAFFVLTSCFGATDTLPNPVMITGSNGIQFYKNNAGGFAGTDLPVPSNYIQLAGVYLTD